MTSHQLPWILLRGLVREQRHWGAFKDVFSRCFAGVRVIALDLPGNGSQRRESSPLTISAMVESVRWQLAQQGVQGPVRLLAVSMGGMVASHWARHYPHEVHAQVLINTSMRPFNPPWERLRATHYASLLQLLLGGATALQWEEAILRMTANAPHPHAVQDWVQLREDSPVSTVNAVRQLVAAARYRASRRPPPCPTLLLASTQDRLVSVRCSRAIAQAWNVVLLEHPWAGHDLTLDDAGWVAHQVVSWVAPP